MLIAAVFFGLWKLENSTSRFDATIPSLEGKKSAAAIKQMALKKRRVYEGNPALDLEVQDIRVYGGHDNPTHTISRVYGYRNIIAPDTK